jgi:hypothetical protein
MRGEEKKRSVEKETRGVHLKDMSTVSKVAPTVNEGCIH